MHRKWLMILVLCLINWPVQAASAGPLLSEVATASVDSSSQEFVELYNPESEDVDLTGWSLEYAPASAQSWSVKAELAGVMPAHGFYLVATPDYLEADGQLDSGLSNSSGHIRLVDAEGEERDLLGWGAAVAPEAEAAPAPAPGGSLERLPGELVADGGNGHDSDDNVADWQERTEAEPQNSTAEPELPFEGELPAPTPPDPAGPFLPVTINELLVDPELPATDGDDEFIELFNPHPQAVDLSGYVLRTGTNLSYDYELDGQVIEPGGYVVLYSAQTGLALSNTGGQAALENPAGSEVSAARAYSKAPEGASWSLFGSGWQWSARPTPGATNQMQAVASKTRKAATKKAASSRRSSRAAAAKTSPVVAAAQTPQATTATLWLLIGLAAFTIGYGLYELRYDLYSYYQLTKRYFKRRRSSG